MPLRCFVPDDELAAVGASDGRPGQHEKARGEAHNGASASCTRSSAFDSALATLAVPAPVAQGIERCPAEAEVACSNHAGRMAQPSAFGGDALVPCPPPLPETGGSSSAVGERHARAYWDQLSLARAALPLRKMKFAEPRAYWFEKQHLIPAFGCTCGLGPVRSTEHQGSEGRDVRRQSSNSPRRAL